MKYKFGYGAHVCPGRFYAVKKAKLVLGRLIRNYEFKWDGNVKVRPSNVSIEARTVLSPDARILIRSWHIS